MSFECFSGFQRSLGLGFDFWIGPVATLMVESCPVLDLSGLSAFLEVGPVVKSPCVSSLPFKLFWVKFRITCL